MRFSIVVAALSFIVAISAAKVDVMVGINGTLTYQPWFVNASVGDVVAFTFLAGNHTVTQSSFTNPCQSLSGGVDSGFIPINSTATKLVQWSITVNQTSPMWFYCGKTKHCQLGMVFAINPTTSKPFSTFQAAAQSNNSTNSSTSTTGSNSSNSSTTAAVSATSTAAKTTATSGATKMRDSTAAGLLMVVGMVMGLVL